MKNHVKKYRTTELFGVIAVAALLAGCSDNQFGRSSGPKADDVKVASQFNELPPAVQKTVKEQAPNGVIDKISTETKDGRLTYKIKFQDEGLNPALWVTADGNVLKSDISRDKAFGATGAGSETSSGSARNLKFTELPAAVQKTVREQEPTAAISDIDKRTKDGQVVYEISFKEKGVNPKITVAADGTLIKGESKGVAVEKGSATNLRFEELPIAVRKSVRERVPEARIADIDKSTRDGRIVYDISFEEPGKNPKMRVSEDGTVLKGLEK
jgi:uncharacterized membrane protein YkoI